MAKQVVTTLRVYPAAAAVSIPFVAQFIDDDGEVQANEVMEQAADAMLDELLMLSDALSTVRAAAAGA